MGFLSTVGQIGGFFLGGQTGSAIGAGIGGAIEGVEGVSGASSGASADTLQAAREAEALNIERYGEARELLDPYISEARTAREQQMVEMGLAPGEAGAYMTPGYESLFEERQRGVEQAAATGGTLYSGRRMRDAADVSGATQSQFYNNYMGMLQNLGSPNVATNVASMGVNQGQAIGRQNIGAQQAASGYQMQGAAANQAFTGDLIGGAANIYGSYLANQTPLRPPATAAYGDAYQPARQAGYI